MFAADDADLPRWLAAARPAWFAHPRLLDRLDLMFVSRTLGIAEDADELPPYLEAHVRSALVGASPVRRLASNVLPFGA